MTDIVQGLILGVVQGITEWLPVSSEGVITLILVHFFDEPTGEAIAKSVWLHVGTLLAAMIYFRSDVSELVRRLPRYVRERGARSSSEPDSLITFLTIATVLTGAVGAPLMLFELSQESISGSVGMAVIGAFLMITGVVQKYARRASGTRVSVGKRDAVLLGVVQGFAAVPGLSRSGLTVSAFLLRGYEVRQAIRVSFLMSIPAVLAAEVGLGLIGELSFDAVAISGVVTSFLFGLLTIGVLVRVVTRISFWKFCLVLGALSLLPLVIELV